MPLTSPSTPPLVSTFDAIPGAGVTELPQASAAGFPDDWFYDTALGPGLGTSSGVRVGAAEALGHAPFFQGVNIIAGDIGLLPISVQRREPFGQSQRWLNVDSHRIEWLLNEEPNDYQTPEIFKETLQQWALVYGNGCALKAYGRRGEVEALLPLFPERLFCEHDTEHGWMLVYQTLDGRRIAIAPEDVFHIRGLATDGFWGKSAVRVARNVFGLGIAAREHAAGTLKNGGRPSGLLETPYEDITPDARRKLREEWQEVHGGAAGSGRLGVLTAGMKYAAISMSNVDVQLLELMRLDKEQVASLLNLPAFMLNALENASVRANVAESYRDYYRRTLARWGGRWGGEAKRKLIPAEERRRSTYRVGVDAESFVGGNPDERMKRAVLGVRGKVTTRNEGREVVGLNPVEGGDDFENPAIDTNQNAGGSDDEPAAGNEETQADVAALREQLRRAEAEAAGLRAENERLKSE